MFARFSFGLYLTAGLLEVGYVLQRPEHLSRHTVWTAVDILLAIFFFTNAKERL